MPLMYVKLGVGINAYSDERTSLHLVDGIKPAGIVDYTNANEDIFESLRTGELVQINQAEYYGILQTVNPPSVINITTNYLVSLQNYLNTCPLNSTVLFAYQDNAWYKIRWDKVKECLVAGATGGTADIRFRVGDPDNALNFEPPILIPGVGDTELGHPAMIGKTHNQISLRVGGIEIYERSLYLGTPGWGDYDHFILDSNTGILTRPATFKENEPVALTVT